MPGCLIALIHGEIPYHFPNGFRSREVVPETKRRLPTRTALT